MPIHTSQNSDVLQEHRRKQKEMEQLEKQIKDFRESRRQDGGIGDSS